MPVARSQVKEDRWIDITSHIVGNIIQNKANTEYQGSISVLAATANYNVKSLPTDWLKENALNWLSHKTDFFLQRITFPPNSEHQIGDDKQRFLI